MTTRLAPFLDRVAVLLLIGVVAAPLLLAAVQSLPPRPNVQWTVSVPWFGGPRMGVPLEDHFDPPWGSTIVLTNTGNEESEDVRLVLGPQATLGPRAQATWMWAAAAPRSSS
ncbi:hypothetical protein [Rubellimicrobium mesophilum]|uniref:hypothetical protein n=1 Tax=Rubellimicrobium mesophilum TaxID=1123067 RepID=UPI00056CFD0C|nr:hypothetical protein [Rubellimicrobium mesophilum]